MYNIYYVYVNLCMHVTLVIAIRCPAAMQLFGLSNAPNSHHHHHYVHPWTEVHSNAGFLFQLSSAHITTVLSPVRLLFCANCSESCCNNNNSVCNYWNLFVLLFSGDKNNDNYSECTRSMHKHAA